MCWGDRGRKEGGVQGWGNGLCTVETGIDISERPAVKQRMAARINL